MSLKILTRDVPPRSAWALEQAGIHPLLSRLYAARGIVSPEELDDGLAKLLAPNTLKGSQEAASLLADAIAANKRLCIVADYDCDGATATERLQRQNRLDALAAERPQVELGVQELRDRRDAAGAGQWNRPAWQAHDPREHHAGKRLANVVAGHRGKALGPLAVHAEGDHRLAGLLAKLMNTQVIED